MLEICVFEFEIYLEFDAWDLEFIMSIVNGFKACFGMFHFDA